MSYRAAVWVAVEVALVKGVEWIIESRDGRPLAPTDLEFARRKIAAGVLSMRHTSWHDDGRTCEWRATVAA